MYIVLRWLVPRRETRQVRRTIRCINYQAFLFYIWNSAPSKYQIWSRSYSTPWNPIDVILSANETRMKYLSMHTLNNLLYESFQASNRPTKWLQKISTCNSKSKLCMIFDPRPYLDKPLTGNETSIPEVWFKWRTFSKYIFFNIQMLTLRRPGIR